MTVNILRAWRLNKITGSRRWDPGSEVIALKIAEFERKGGKIDRIEDARVVATGFAQPRDRPQAVPSGYGELYALGLGAWNAEVRKAK